VVLAHFGPTGEQAARLQALGLFGAPIVTMFHGMDVRMLERRPEAFPLLRERGARFLVTGEGYAGRVLREAGFPSERIRVHRVGVRPVRAAPRARGRRPVLLTVARLVEEKGHEHLLRALAKLDRPDLRVVWLGDGPLRGALEAQAEQLGVREQLELRGAATRDEVQAALEEADLFVLPSVAEALPVCLMEAGAAGLPVVATRVGSVDEIVNDGVTGWLCPPADDDALVDTLRRALGAPDRWPALGRAARAHVEAGFDIDKLNDRLSALLDELAGSARR
jgi:colanic acid/amylovoran biosynthesis glycosyltransferase